MMSEMKIQVVSENFASLAIYRSPHFSF